MSTEKARPRKAGKVAAITAGAVIIGIGATFTLATWNDSEWVNGLLEGEAGIGTSEFEVQQNAMPANELEAADFGDSETSPGNALTFAMSPLALTPGDTIYAPVSLRTTADSVAGTVTLQPAVSAPGVTAEDTGGLLWDAIEVTVYTSNVTPDTRPTCDAATVGTGNWTAIDGIDGLDDTAAQTQSLDAEAASTQHYCFTLTLPADASDDLQGRTIAPTWEFASESETEN
ncbi:MAG: SipW-dependent-type signal peptide-containing protein [Gulosibacter sp.]|uniref:SipW-dependent-type signal peptide-containing protein n=1 Tax=Gulosibacter sp. TaxID=2817531 RepID=UPI003F8DCAF2